MLERELYCGPLPRKVRGANTTNNYRKGYAGQNIRHGGHNWLWDHRRVEVGLVLRGNLKFHMRTTPKPYANTPCITISF